MTWLAVLKIMKIAGNAIKENWKAAVAMAILLSVVGYMGCQRHTINRQAAEIEVLTQENAHLATANADLTTANLGWKEASIEWVASAAELERKAHDYELAYRSERDRRLRALLDLAETEEKLAKIIVSKDCEGALNELLSAFDWK